MLAVKGKVVVPKSVLKKIEKFLIWTPVSRIVVKRLLNRAHDAVNIHVRIERLYVPRN
jgi:hypothetical protein